MGENFGKGDGETVGADVYTPYFIRIRAAKSASRN